MQALPTVLAPIVRIRKGAELTLKRTSARAATARRAALRDPARGPGARRRAVPARALSEVDRRRRRWPVAQPGLRRPRVRDPVALHRRHPRRRPARAGRQDLHRRGVRHARDHAARSHGRRACGCRPCPTARRSPSRTWRCSCWATCSSTNWRRAASAQHPRRTSATPAARPNTRMRGKRGVNVFMLAARPHEPVPAGADVQPAGRQHPQHRHRGVFDDRRDIVKAVSGDLAFKRRYRIGTVNSINWARLLAGGVLLRRLLPGDQPERNSVSFAVPSGNFGNICAGHVARMMGLPIRRLVAATNENDVLDEFFRTGTYRVRGGRDARDLEPSMDIQGVELRALLSSTCRPRRRARASCSATPVARRFVRPSPAERERLPASASRPAKHARRPAGDDPQPASRCGTMIDPHTADGVKVARELQREPGVPMIATSRRRWAKFAATIAEAWASSRRPRPRGIVRLPKRRCTVMPADTEAVKRFIEAQLATPPEGRRRMKVVGFGLVGLGQDDARRGRDRRPRGRGLRLGRQARAPRVRHRPPRQGHLAPPPGGRVRGRDRPRAGAGARCASSRSRSSPPCINCWPSWSTATGRWSRASSRPTCTRSRSGGLHRQAGAVPWTIRSSSAVATDSPDRLPHLTGLPILDLNAPGAVVDFLLETSVRYEYIAPTRSGSAPMLTLEEALSPGCCRPSAAG